MSLLKSSLMLAKVISNVLVCYLDIPKLIVINQGLPFISKFRFLLYYFLGIKKRIFTTFHPQIDSKTDLIEVIALI